MGTSQSSSGSPSGVPMVPPWVPDPIGSDNGGQGDDDGGNDSIADSTGSQNEQPSRPQRPVPVAPRGRFGPARRNLGRFARTGSVDDMRKGVGHYVRKGLGGSRTAARRLGGTARTAGSLYGALSAVSSGQAAVPGSRFDPVLLQGRSADEIMDALVEAVRPVDGTQDSEAARYAVNDALSDVLSRYPDADLLNLTEPQRLFAIERYISMDVFSRFALDVGKQIGEKAPSLSAELARLREVKNYIRETVAASFRKAQSDARSLNANRITEMVRDALQEAFDVFDGYL